MTERRNTDDAPPEEGGQRTDETKHATDPRLDRRYLRKIPATASGGDVVLIGVTHDHPASRARAREVIGTVRPEVVALELSPLAVPLYRQYAAANDRAPDTETDVGGEMAAALSASEDARVVGIDAPTATYGRRLAERLISSETDRDAAVAALRDTASVTAHALTCAVGAGIRAVTPWQPITDTPADHDTDATDPPAEQAAHEARQLSRSRALLGALEMPPGQQLVDELREASMAARLESLRRDGAVVAVVGHAHLDPIHERLTGR